MVLAGLVMLGFFMLVQVGLLVVIMVHRIEVFADSSLQPAINAGGMDVVCNVDICS